MSYINFENFLQDAKIQTKNNQKDLDDILAGKKSAEDIEYHSDSMQDFPSVTKKIDKTSSMSIMAAAVYEEE